MLTQKNYPASEPQFICGGCSEVVINPLCPFCLTIEVEAWLTLYPDLKNDVMPRINRYLSRLDSDDNPSTRCIKCGYKSTFLCPYCFTNHVLGELKRINVNKIILKEFFEFFNYDFDHTGYYKEGERLGVF